MLLLGAILLALFVVPSPWGVLLVAGAAVGEIAEAAVLIRWSKRRRAQVGVEALVGKRAQVVERCMPFGQVRVDGELWQARCEAGADPGELVRVRSIEGLRLVVEPDPGVG